MQDLGYVYETIMEIPYIKLSRKYGTNLVSLFQCLVSNGDHVQYKCLYCITLYCLLYGTDLASIFCIYSFPIKTCNFPAQEDAVKYVVLCQYGVECPLGMRIIRIQLNLASIQNILFSIFCVSFTIKSKYEMSLSNYRNEI